MHMSCTVRTLGELKMMLALLPMPDDTKLQLADEADVVVVVEDIEIYGHRYKTITFTDKAEN